MRRFGNTCLLKVPSKQAWHVFTKDGDTYLGRVWLDTEDNVYWCSKRPIAMRTLLEACESLLTLSHA
jgi:hypothetical protein